ncbi:hypothetical protein CY34DRAFT_106313 [Suillus luteus UH-Slu-Lm8-n1]|uniref:Uncharacterized protein n=1 Tax=Suillus luteus UH-Slu-Lm8-n1 TaxID=930992 RepID=A0A0D0B180_9AGAM|nr:hypothetical protein CY34DRAFT_106313 [Suillus luteus UH-Slu-Lm8-n1]
MVGFEAVWLDYCEESWGEHGEDMVLDVNAGSGNHGQVLSIVQFWCRQHEEDQALDVGQWGACWGAIVGPCFVVEQANGSVSARDGRADSSQDSLKEGWITGRVVVFVVESLARDAESAMAQYGRLVDAIQERGDTGLRLRNDEFFRRPAGIKHILLHQNPWCQVLRTSHKPINFQIEFRFESILPNQVDVCICMMFWTGKSIHARGHCSSAPPYPEIRLPSERCCLKAVLLLGMMVGEVKQCPPICLTFSTSCVESTLCDGVIIRSSTKDVGVG